MFNKVEQFDSYSMSQMPGPPGEAISERVERVMERGRTCKLTYNSETMEYYIYRGEKNNTGY